jgi:hypothetical protein
MRAVGAMAAVAAFSAVQVRGLVHVARALVRSRAVAFAGPGVHLSSRDAHLQRARAFSAASQLQQTAQSVEAEAAAPSQAAEAPFKANLLAMTQADLEALLKSWGEPKYRAKQILQSAFDNGKSFSKMQTLPLALREKLEANLSIGTLSLAAEQVSNDGTRKRAYALGDGQLIESVLMPYADGRRTACISRYTLAQLPS